MNFKAESCKEEKNKRRVVRQIYVPVRTLAPQLGVTESTKSPLSEAHTLITLKETSDAEIVDSQLEHAIDVEDDSSIEVKHLSRSK